MKYKDNIKTYLKWRGDITLRQSPINEVDSLIMAELVYLDFGGIVPEVGSKDAITIEEAAVKYGELHREAFPNETGFIETLGRSARFSKMKLCNYISDTNVEKEKQFAAMHINMGGNKVYIAFRGTDKSLVAWKEDFNMTYMMPVPAQEAALEYINTTAKGFFKKYYIGGHSKGGNLAVYGSVFCKDSLKRKIQFVHSFDGPGFQEKLVEDKSYLMIKDKIVSFVPQGSVIGMLLEHREEHIVVESQESGLMQHTMLSWYIDCKRLQRCEKLDDKAIRTNQIITSIIGKMSMEERKHFVNSFFLILEEAGVENLQSINLKSVGAILLKMKDIPAENRDALLKIFKLILEEKAMKRPKV